MARLRHTAQKSIIPFLPSRLAERPLRRPVTGQFSHLERLHHRLHKELERRRQELEQHSSSSSPQQEVESVRSCSPMPPLEAPPTPQLGIPAARVAVGGDPDDGGDDSSLSHSTDLSEEQEPEGWVARPITCDAAHGCHFHDALDTLLRQVLDRVPCLSSITVLSSSTVVRFTRIAGRRLVWCAVRRIVSRVQRSAQSITLSLSGTHVAWCALSHYCSVLGGVANGLNLWYYPNRPSGSIGGMVVSPVGEGNPRLSSTINLVVVLNTELDHALDELSRARAEIAQLRAERAERRHLEDGSPAPVGTQHP
jgi:hypothetical protein